MEETDAFADARLSLLFAGGRTGPHRVTRLDASAWEDLRLNGLIEKFVVNKKRADAITGIMTGLCLDIEDIRYRQEILGDFMDNSMLFECIEEILPRIFRLQFYLLHPGKSDIPPFQETVWRIRELEHYVYCIDRLKRTFQAAGSRIRSAGMKKLSSVVDRVADNEGFAELRCELPRLLECANGMKSVTIGVNLNEGMFPVEAALLSVSDVPYKSSGVLDKLTKSAGEYPLGPLYRDPGEFHSEVSMSPLFRDIFKTMQKSVKPIQKILSRFGRIEGTMLVNLLDEFLFYLGAAGLFSGLMEKGYAFSAPEVLPETRAVFKASGMYNLDLALMNGGRDFVVCNDFDCRPEKRIFVLTGPNHGGKTTFLQAVGLVQVFAQLGLLVPAASASIGVCDNVFTHYPVPEKPGLQTGRFGEEAQRLRALLEAGTGSSMYLLNETFSSTSYGEALFIAGDVLDLLNRRGARCIFATHLHQLADTAQTQTEDPAAASSAIESIVAGIEEGPDGNLMPTYVISSGKPQGKSYARELARKYGISGDQLEELLSGG